MVLSSDLSRGDEDKMGWNGEYDEGKPLHNLRVEMAEAHLVLFFTSATLCTVDTGRLLSAPDFCNDGTEWTEFTSSVALS